MLSESSEMLGIAIENRGGVAWAKNNWHLSSAFTMLVMSRFNHREALRIARLRREGFRLP